jgi:hypothetical protein
MDFSLAYCSDERTGWRMARACRTGTDLSCRTTRSSLARSLAETGAEAEEMGAEAEETELEVGETELEETEAEAEETSRKGSLATGSEGAATVLVLAATCMDPGQEAAPLAHGEIHSEGRIAPVAPVAPVAVVFWAGI